MDARRKWVVTCLALGAIVLAVVVWTSGWSWWTLALVALLLVCPVMIAWLAFGGLDAGNGQPRSDSR